MTTATPQQRTAARALIERVTRQGQPVASEYPLLFEESFPGQLVALEEEQSVRSACGVLVRDFLLPDGGTVRGGLIGSVCTDPEFEGRGYATRVLSEAEATLAAEGCAFALLWADSAPFYLDRGYSPIGTEEDYGIDARAAERLPKIEGVRELNVDEDSDVDSVHRLYEQHTARVARTSEETRALLRCPGMETLVVEREGNVVAYACCGRGEDFANAVHEWGGRTEDLLGLIGAHYQRRFGNGEEGNLFLLAPPCSEELATRLLALGALHARGILGLGKVLDRSAVAALLHERLQPNGTASVIEGPTGQQIRITGPADDDVVDDDGALALLCGTAELHPHIADFLDRFGLQGAALPLEPFAWGLDSI